MILIVGLPSDIRREIEQYNREHPRPPRPHYYTQQELAPIVPKRSLYERFETRFVWNGIVRGMLVQPEPGHGDHLGLPLMFMISFESTFYGWLRFRVLQWQWLHRANEQPLADAIGNVIEQWFE